MKNLGYVPCDQQTLRSACTPTQYDKILFYSSLDYPETVEGICDHQRLWSDCTDLQGLH